MATRLGIVNLTGCSYELAYDILSQNVEGNYSNVRLYGILHVTNNYVSWSRGSASVHTSGLQSIGTYYSRGDYTVITRDFVFTHDNNGKFSNYIGASLSTTFVSGDCNGLLTLPDIPRYAVMTNAINNPTDESNFWFTYSNPANSNMSCWLEINPSGEHLCIRTLSGTSGQYNWELTTEERNQIRAKLANSNKGTLRIGLYSTIGGTTQPSYIDRTINIINANPIFSNFEFEDINPVTLALTGDSSVNVNGYSNIQATISVANKASAIKEATMSKYQFKIGNNNPLNINYSNDSVVSGIINNSISGTYNMFAIDSRGNSTLVTKVASSEISYQPIFIDKQNSVIQRNDNQVGENAVLTLNGTIWNDDFGDVVNSVTDVTYRFKKTDSSTWIDGTTTITPTVSNNTFSFTGQIASDNLDTTWDLDASYNIEVTIEDELSSYTANFILNSAIPTISLDKEGVGIKCAYNNSLGGLLQVGGNIVDGLQRFEDTEQLIGYWLGEKLYRKVINVGSIGNYEKKVNINVQNLKKIINMYGRTEWSGFTLPLNMYNKTSGNGTYLFYSNNEIYLRCDFGNATNTYAIIEYTKTSN